MTAGLSYGKRPRPTIEERLTVTKDGQNEYRPNDDVISQLTGTTLGSLVGVTGSGKSHLIPFVITHGGKNFSEVGNMSSRAKRDTDPANFRGSRSLVELLGRIHRRELVQYVVHGSGDIYATDPASYETSYVVLPTLTTALPQLQASGCFNQIIPIGIVTDGETWDNERLGENRHNLARMQEALTCVAWLRAHMHHIPILENKTGAEEATAQKIVDIMLDPSHPRPLDNLKRVELLLDELTAVATRHARRLERL